VKILLADDSMTAQNMGRKILSEAGHDVICVSNGAAAIKKITEQRPDVVILDVYMPGYTGLEVCQRIRETRDTARMPVLLSVGKLEPFSKEDAQRVRAAALIVKPFEATELVSTISRIAEFVEPRRDSKSKAEPRSKQRQTRSEEENFDSVASKTAQLIQNAVPDEPAIAKPATTEFEVVASTPPSTPGSEEAEQIEVRVEEEAGSDASVAAESVPSAASISLNENAHVDSAETKQPLALATAAAVGASPSLSGSFSESLRSSTPIPPVPAAVENNPLRMLPPAESGTVLEAKSESTSAIDVSPAISAQGCATDPALVEDRTQWATEFPTRFGIQEPEEASAQASEDSRPSADELDALLASIPESAVGIPVEKSGTDIQDWSRSASDSAPGWRAEEVPVSDEEERLSLSTEMESAFATSASQVPAQHTETETVWQQNPAETSVITVCVGDSKSVASPEEPTTPAEPAHDFAASSESGINMEPVEIPALDSSAQPSAPLNVDPVAQSIAEQITTGSIPASAHSAAVDIATEHLIANVALEIKAAREQLPAKQQEDSPVGAAAIEDLVNRVLERLKPKLIAEIAKELSDPEEQ
jgi:CheY-like chemotaxis protein